MSWGIMTNYSTRSESFFVRESNDYLVDAGKGSTGGSIIKFYGKHNYTLDVFVISHGDSDHIGLAKDVIEHLKPKYIVISPVVFVWEKFKYYKNQFYKSYDLNNKNIRPNYLPTIFFNSELNEDYELINQLDNSDGFPEMDDNSNDRSQLLTWPIVYSVRKGITNSMPWTNSMFGSNLKEFETFITKKSLEIAIPINKFVDHMNKYIQSNPSPISIKVMIKDFLAKKDINNYYYSAWINKIINHISNGITQSRPIDEYVKLFEILEKEFLKRVRNEMSLICRIGNIFFTGDAGKEQLQEVKPLFLQRKHQLKSISIKVNHHGSCLKKYESFDFYNELKPKQLILKRDYQVEGSKGFNTYYQALVNISSIQNIVDSHNHQGKRGIVFSC